MKEPRDNQTSFESVAVSCERVENRVHELLDLREALLSDSMVRDHISECDQCAQLVVDLGALNESVSQIPLATLHRLSGIHVAELVEDYEPSKPAHPVLFVASIASLLLVALTSGLWFSGNSNQIAVVDSLAQNEVVSVAVEDGSGESSSDNGSSNGIGSNGVGSQNLEVSVPETMQQLGLVTVHKTSLPTDFIGAVNFEEISGNVEPYQEYIGMTADLPGMRPVSNSVNATIELMKTFSSQRAAYSAL